MTLDDNRVTQEQGVALVDFRSKTGACNGDAKVVANMVRGSYTHQEGDDYTGVEFQLGLPAAINHGALNTDGILSKAVDMHWNWLAGYRYLRMDVVPVGGVTKLDSSTASNWNVHLGGHRLQQCGCKRWHKHQDRRSECALRKSKYLGCESGRIFPGE